MKQALLALSFLLTTVAPAFANDNPVYDMVCHCGYNMSVTYNLAIGPTGMSAPTAVIGFAASKVLPNQNGTNLAVGTCALTRRLFNNTEATTITVPSPTVQIRQTKCGNNNTCGVAASTSILGSADWATDFTKIMKLKVQYDGQTWQMLGFE